VAVSGTRVKLAIGIPLGLAVIGLAVYLLLPFTIGDDYVEPPDCECELLREWVADLAILPTEGDTTISDTFNQFTIEHLVEPVPENDEALRDQLLEALRIPPFRVTTDSQPDSWNIAASPRTTNENAGFSWNVLFQSQDRLLVSIRVGSDLSAWGITFDDLEALSDDEFDRLMTERQAAAIEVLKPFSDALQAVESPTTTRRIYASGQSNP
jgi:hypothetical protein